MTPEDVAKNLNQGGIFSAEVHQDGYLSVVGTYALPAMMRSSSWALLFRGVRFRIVRLEVNHLSDEYVHALGAAEEIQHLVLKGNESITGAAFDLLPSALGFQTLDVAITAIGDRDIDNLLRFPRLITVWGHAQQFTAEALRFAKAKRPDVTFKLIY